MYYKNDAVSKVFEILNSKIGHTFPTFLIEGSTGLALADIENAIDTLRERGADIDSTEIGYRLTVGIGSAKVLTRAAAPETIDTEYELIEALDNGDILLVGAQTGREYVARLKDK